MFCGRGQLIYSNLGSSCTSIETGFFSCHLVLATLQYIWVCLLCMWVLKMHMHESCNRVNVCLYKYKYIYPFLCLSRSEATPPPPPLHCAKWLNIVGSRLRHAYNRLTVELGGKSTINIGAPTVNHCTLNTYLFLEILSIVSLLSDQYSLLSSLVRRGGGGHAMNLAPLFSRDMCSVHLTSAVGFVRSGCLYNTALHIFILPNTPIYYIWSVLLIYLAVFSP
jgi:hypothetical protein